MCPWCSQVDSQLLAQPCQIAISVINLTLHCSPPPMQGGAGAAAATAATAAAMREKEGKINDLIEELGNKEMLLSEAQAQLAAVR